MLIRHSILYVAARLAAGCMSVATTAMLTRLMDPTRYGLYGLILIVMGFVSAIAFDWLGITVIRFVQARRGDPSTRSTVFLMFLGLVGATGLVSTAALVSGFLPPIWHEMLPVSVALVWCYAWCEITAQYEVASLQPVRYLTIYTTRSVLVFAGSVGAAWLTHSPYMVALASSAAMLIATVFGTLFRVHPRRDRFDNNLAWDMLRFGFPLAASLTISSIIFIGPRLLLQQFASLDALGYYTAAINLVQVTLGVITGGLESATYSLAVKAVESGDREAVQKQLTQNFTLILMVLAPSALGIALTSNTLAHTLLGAQFSAAVAGIIPWMAAASFLGGIRSSYLDKAFQLGHKPGQQVVVMSVASIAVVIASLLLIPKYGALGAAIAVGIAITISCFHARWAARNTFPLPLPGAALWQVGLGCGVMAIVVINLRGHGPSLLALQVVLGAIAYGAVILAFNVMGFRDAVQAKLLQLTLRDRA